MSAKKLNCWQACWTLYLACFDFSLHLWPGQSMGKPDALSQRADHSSGAGDNSNIIFLALELFVVCALKGIALEGVEQTQLHEIYQGNQKGDHEEAVAKAAQELCQSSTKSVCANKSSDSNSLLLFHRRIYVPDLPDL
jgi:hypothetical protein